MWNRANLKKLGKDAFQSNYWIAVVAAFVTGLAVAGVTAVIGLNGGSEIQNMTEGTPVWISAGIAGTSTVAFILNYFVLKPLEIGGRQFFLNNSERRGDINDLLHGFKVNYLNNVLTLFLRDLFTALWSMLFLIPGIVKMYAYRLVPYIMAEHPEMQGTDAIKLSQEMMKGHKWNTFVLDLSFIGWIILSFITMGLVGIFFTNPYMYSTDAELYKAIKAEYNAAEEV